MALALWCDVTMASIPSLEVRKEAARNMEVSKPFCTRTHLMGWLAHLACLSTKKDAPLEWTVFVGLCDASPLCSL
jgi:hypothetical protein